ncbi:hypothetical protein CASFOL_012291 [Castilleja foliolosa]|uniref:Uncharacterized protein n=1 Tax=Castilleja foliolosa TaxID=1961234 RepID=A0ABD3DTM7_9LAMI
MLILSGQDRCLVTNLGLQNYEKKFKKGLLNDTTLPFADL